MAGVRYVIYKRCVPGDRKKVQAVSNKTPSGGGARDLRFNPWPEFEPVVARMFGDLSVSSTGRTVYRTLAYWFGDGALQGPTGIAFWSPNPSRSGDGRLSQVHKIVPFGEEYLPAAELDPFFLIWQDTEGKVWARYVTVPELREGEWHPKLATPILDSVESKPPARNIRGWVDLENDKGVHLDVR